ncbi:hypothetical protein Lal_00038653 [Lupinus albus]|nr:hypothetical protein Lal_00038653 [Lupinus albus]
MNYTLHKIPLSFKNLLSFDRVYVEMTNLISCGPMTHISDIKLIRTDTTLDLSQKAEKGMSYSTIGLPFYTESSISTYWPCQCGIKNNIWCE